MTQADIPASTSADPPRPATVTVAFALQVALVGTLLLMIGTAVAHAIRYDGLIDQALQTSGAGRDLADDERAGNLTDTLIISVPALVVAVWLGITSVWLRRGSYVARVLTWVGLLAPVVVGVLFCVLGGLFGVLMESAMEDSEIPPDESAAGDPSAFYNELMRLDNRGWSIVFNVLGPTSAVLALLLAIAVGVLLLSGPSNAYFRPPRTTPGPPPPYPQWPAQGYQYPMPPYAWYPTPPHIPGPYPPATPPQQPPSPPAS